MELVVETSDYYCQVIFILKKQHSQKSIVEAFLFFRMNFANEEKNFIKPVGNTKMIFISLYFH